MYPGVNLFLFLKPMEDTRNLIIWFFWPCAPCSHWKREASLLHPSEENGSEVLNSTFIYLDALDISFQLLLSLCLAINNILMALSHKLVV